METSVAGVLPEPVRYDARAILEMESCRPATSVELMARRWCLEPGKGARPDMLVGARFARVPALRIHCPSAAGVCWEVWISGWAPEVWFHHLRVTYPGATYTRTLRHPDLGAGTSTSDDPTQDTNRLWTSYVATFPEGTPWIEVSKTDEMEGRLVAVEFRPVREPPEPLRRRDPWADPIVIGIVDHGGVYAGTFQAYDPAPVEDFYRQMRAMGFTDLYQQIYGGFTDWGKVGRRYKQVASGHMSYANWHEPADIMAGSHGPGPVQADIDRVRRGGLRYVADFRINNEWMAAWCREAYPAADGIPEIASAFVVEHPEFWATYKSGERNGGGLDFAFPEVRQYRLAIIEEWLRSFHGTDGVCIDLYRHPPMVSYPEHLVQEFTARTGIDVRTVEPVEENTMIPEWLQFRAQPFTEFMRSVRGLVRELTGGAVYLTARVANTFERAMFDGADLRVWIEEGLVDQLLLQHREPHNPLGADSRAIVEAARARGIRVVHILEVHTDLYVQQKDLSKLRVLLDRWRGWGSDGFGFYEAERAATEGRVLRELPSIVNHWRE